MTTLQQNKQTVNFELPPISQDDISQTPQLHCRQKSKGNKYGQNKN